MENTNEKTYTYSIRVDLKDVTPAFRSYIYSMLNTLYTTYPDNLHYETLDTEANIKNND